MSWISRLLTGGPPPEEYLALSADPTTLFHAAGVAMTGRAAKLRSPNRRSSKSITLHRNGRIVITRTQLMLWIGRRLRCHATFATDESAPFALEFRADGFTLDADVAKALPPNGEGSMQLVARVQIPQTALNQLPSHLLRATVPEHDVLSMTRWV